jgi:dTDP-4-amino-4,6-dideoxygalactose transaminase
MTYYATKYGYDPAGYPHATAISDHSIALPVGPHLSEADVDVVGHAFLKALEGIAQ